MNDSFPEIQLFGLFIAEKLLQNLVARSSITLLFLHDSTVWAVLGGISLFLFYVASSGCFRWLGAAGMA